MNMFFISVLAFLFAIGVLVAVHEWGHYIVARLSGVRVLRFSIGFGRPLWSRRSGPDQTEYCLSALPLGGYVKLLDEREGDVEPSELHRAFTRIPIRNRIAILLAGPLMNFIFAIFAYWLMYSIGVPGSQPIVGAIAPASIAAESGLREGDRIVRVGDRDVATWEGAVFSMLDEMLAEERIPLDLERRDGSLVAVELDVGGKVAILTEPGRLFTGLGISAWSPEIDPVIGEVISGGSAESAGLVPGDKLLAAAGDRFQSWSQWVEFVRARPNQTVRLELLRDGARLSLDLAIGEIAQADGVLIGRIGAGPFIPEGFYDQYTANQRFGWWESLAVALEKTWSMSALTIKMVGSIVFGDVSVKNISGPINIAHYAGYSASIGVSSFLNFLAVVSLSLGILNLLPIPVLDGGQVVYQLLEAMKGSPLSMRAQVIGQQIGVLFLVLLMGFAFYNDLSSIFS